MLERVLHLPYAKCRFLPKIVLWLRTDRHHNGERILTAKNGGRIDCLDSSVFFRTLPSEIKAQPAGETAGRARFAKISDWQSLS